MKRYIIVNTELYNSGQDGLSHINAKQPNICLTKVPEKFNNRDIHLCLSKDNPIDLGCWSWNGTGHVASGVKQLKELVTGGFSRKDVEELFPIEYMF